MYFSYNALDEELYSPDGQPLGRTVGGGRPGSAKKSSRPKSSRPGSARAGKKGANVGSLRDSVADLGDDTKKAKAAYPEARGLVKGRGR